MSEGLCWKCKEQFHLWVGSGAPWVHCHHEPKEKPKCWCEYKHDLKQEKVILQWLPGENKAFDISFCPVCGRKL
jgi:hypothetical protein